MLHGTDEAPCRSEFDPISHTEEVSMSGSFETAMRDADEKPVDHRRSHERLL